VISTPVHVLARVSPGEASNGARMNDVDERVVDVSQQSSVGRLGRGRGQLDCSNTTAHSTANRLYTHVTTATHTQANRRQGSD